ncbi:Yip1 family protein [Candidatus Venteria ishoeyi]|uniref:Inner membrane protein YohC n=1 Tax=Candidatus Venteria ishoeyi TaxID=1899563 RepID=A0A1H6FES0_9GAMM|nr:Yip1 family protein [Candidatus Venteria ishoeyi]MDM8545066.1 Yip1 family protein [Candidatus Venteria ishoeyi]SEH07911.1 Inner membrane protein YohC [Candidatus Venteria ishoeyi]
MTFRYLWGLLYQPALTWAMIRDTPCSMGACYARHVLILPLIPAISAYFGMTQIGWKMGFIQNSVFLTPESALPMAVLSWLAMVAGVFFMAYMLRWMSSTYAANPNFTQCILLALYIVSPLMLSGFMFIYPMLWINLLLALPALTYTIYLLYLGLPIVMQIPEERGFLFSSAILMVGLIVLVAMLAMTALLWGYGLAPNFTS